ncbi:hypothetical protein ExPECSC017_01715 [Escherichia coli]|nr:hypothetical protein ExPECSC017_01715 [Escherichia coli]
MLRQNRLQPFNQQRLFMGAIATLTEIDEPVGVEAIEHALALFHVELERFRGQRQRRLDHREVVRHALMLAMSTPPVPTSLNLCEFFPGQSLV